MGQAAFEGRETWQHVPQTAKSQHIPDLTVPFWEFIPWKYSDTCSEALVHIYHCFDMINDKHMSCQIYHTLNGPNSQEWAGLNPGTWNSIGVSRVGTVAQRLGTSSTDFLGA